MRRLILLLVLALAPAVFPFGMSVDSSGLVNLGDLEPGQSELAGGYNYTTDATVVSMNVDIHFPWALTIEANDFVGPTNMPLSSLIWQVSYKVDSIPTSPWYNDIINFPQYPNDIRRPFTSGVADSVINNSIGKANNGSETGTHILGFLFHVNIPSNQQSGTYFTNVRFTLTQ